MQDKKEIREAIDKLLTILENNFKNIYPKQIGYKEMLEMCQDLDVLFKNYEENVKECGLLVIKKYIPILDLLVKIDGYPNHLKEYDKMLQSVSGVSIYKVMKEILDKWG